MSVANAIGKRRGGSPKAVAKAPGGDAGRWSLASFRQRHGNPPALVKPRIAVSAALALIACVTGAVVFDEGAGGIESFLDFTSTFSFVCILAWLLVLALTTEVAWIQQKAPSEGSGH